ncbi:MAG: hypothetical protein KY445_07770 [Armatimonadetes bacterium]|nr:hypothetical protein [Armatimonadota bacterium]
MLSRFFIALFVYAGHLSHPFREEIEGGYGGVSNWWLNAWTYYDSAHFLSIAREGYSASTTPFFPLYPLLLRVFGPDENAMALGGILISNLAFLGALFLFFGLTRQIYGPVIARRGVWLLAFFPAGAFGMAVYTDSLFLLLGLAAFGAARRKAWLWAALFGFLAALTRNYGPVLTLALFFEWQRQRDAAEKPRATTILALAAPLLAFGFVQLFFAQRFGGALAGVSSQGNYFRALTWPLLPLWRDFAGIISGAHLNIVAILNFSATILAFVWLWRRRAVVPRADAVLLLGVLGMHLTLARTIPPYTIGSLRYLFALWPFTQLLALGCGFFTVNRLRLVVGWVMYLLLCAVHSFLFGLKSFLG